MKDKENAVFLDFLSESPILSAALPIFGSIFSPQDPYTYERSLAATNANTELVPPIAFLGASERGSAAGARSQIQLASAAQELCDKGLRLGNISFFRGES